MSPDTHPIAVFFDGDETPTYRLHRGDTWQPERGDISWRIEDQDAGTVIDEYHPRRTAAEPARSH